MRDPHFRWQAGSSSPCQSFHKTPVSGASISTLNHNKKEWSIAWALKLSIYVVHKAAAPKNGVEFRQGSIGTIRSGRTARYGVFGVFSKVIQRIVWSVRDPYYCWQARSTLPCSKIDMVNTAEYLEHHQSTLNPTKKKKEKKQKWGIPTFAGRLTLPLLATALTECEYPSAPLFIKKGH